MNVICEQDLARAAVAASYLHDAGLSVEFMSISPRRVRITVPVADVMAAVDLLAPGAVPTSEYSATTWTAVRDEMTFEVVAWGTRWRVRLADGQVTETMPLGQAQVVARHLAGTVVLE